MDIQEWRLCDICVRSIG